VFFKTFGEYGRMAVRFLDPLEGGIFWLSVVVLVERADRQSVSKSKYIFGSSTGTNRRRDGSVL
jgi:hypothetical protein